MTQRQEDFAGCLASLKSMAGTADVLRTAGRKLSVGVAQFMETLEADVEAGVMTDAELANYRLWLRRKDQRYRRVLRALVSVS